MRTALVLPVLALLAAGCTFPGTQEQPRPYYEEVLSASPFTRLVVEVDHAPGYAPSDQALTHLVMTLRNVTSKAEVVLLVQENPDLAGRAERWNATRDLVPLEERTRDTRHEAPTAVMHVLYPAGLYERDGVAGVTVSGNRIGPVVVFLDAIRSMQPVAKGLPPLPLTPQATATIERTTLLHEAGHAVGLVDNGLKPVRDHEDPNSEGHSRNPKSVMWATVDSVQGLRESLLRDGSIPDTFDEDDRADMRSAGGR